MPRKLIEFDRAEVERLLAVGLAAEGKSLKAAEWPPGGVPTGVKVEYEPAPPAPGTVEQLTVRAALVEKLAGLMEQAQLAALDLETELLPDARAWFLARAREAGRFEPPAVPAAV